MRLAEALSILQRPAPAGEAPLRVGLACGFTPAHFQAFLAAHLRLAHGDRPVAVETGLYGDCLGNVERLQRTAAGPVAVVVEWADLDPRLGLRRTGGWGPGDLDDILSNFGGQTRRLGDGLVALGERQAVALALPTLPLPPVSPLPGWQAGPFEVGLGQHLQDLASQLAPFPNVRLLSRQRLDLASPPGGRADVRADLLHGFPYRLPHAAALAELLARLLDPRPPKKGLITDLDNTLWRGVLGDDGPEGVHWDLEHGSQAHALYQQLLGSLAQAGTLVAVASKNDPGLVQEALRRPDVLLRPEQVFPVEAHWAPKSESVARILEAWNVGADSVLFVDDSPLELAEVQAAFPEMECVLFPANDEQGVYDVLGKLRDAFGRSRVTAEDRIRSQSLRQARGFTEPGRPPADYEAFLRAAEAEITLDFTKAPPDPRALELVNKTNQFNLNGRRYTEGEWQAHLGAPDAFLLVVDYRDRFGPLGKIAVLSGRREKHRLQVDTWVLSCRAFSRRVEHACLRELFEGFDVPEIVLAYRPTPKNGPLQGFLAGLSPGALTSPLRLERQAFEARCPELYHRRGGMNHGS